MAARSKQEIRSHWRQNFPFTELQRRQHSQALVKHLLAMPSLKHARQIAVFSALPHEPDLWSLWEQLPDKCVFPKADPATKALYFYKIHSKSDLVKGYAGILEPGPHAHAVTEWYPSDIALVPGFAFDVNGGRIGTGAGFYDRFLAEFPGLRVGIAFETQIHHEPLAQSTFDARMALLCSEAGLMAARTP